MSDEALWLEDEEYTSKNGIWGVKAAFPWFAGLLACGPVDRDSIPARSDLFRECFNLVPPPRQSPSSC